MIMFFTCIIFHYSSLSKVSRTYLRLGMVHLDIHIVNLCILYMCGIQGEHKGAEKNIQS